MEVGLEEIASVREALSAGQRLDGRGPTELPPVEVAVGQIQQAMGSSCLRMGDTEVIVGVKAEVAAPTEHYPDEGLAYIGVQLAAGAVMHAEARKLDDEGTRLASQLTRLLLTRGDKGPAIDLRALCIIRGAACWALHIDCIVVAAGGSPLMALCAGIHKALQDTRVPRVSVDDAIEDASAEDIEVDLDAIAGVPVDVSRLPVVLTACQIGNAVILAGSREEHAAANSTVHVAIAADGRICGVLKAGCRMLPDSVLTQLLAVAQHAGRELAAALQQPIDEEMG